MIGGLYCQMTDVYPTRKTCAALQCQWQCADVNSVRAAQWQLLPDADRVEHSNGSNRHIYHFSGFWTNSDRLSYPGISWAARPPPAAMHRVPRACQCHGMSGMPVGDGQQHIWTAPQGTGDDVRCPVILRGVGWGGSTRCASSLWAAATATAVALSTQREL